MRQKDIKLLWGRSGNRCAICNLELSPEGSAETLGEMAHIVSSKPDGPRGSATCPTETLDTYDNLILLCPTHHTEIDKNEDSWPVSRVREVKRDHEARISSMLEKQGLEIRPVDNSDFTGSRYRDWYDLANGRVAVITSITPLTVTSEAVETQNSRVARMLECASVPSERGGEAISRSKTHPSPFGIVNEDIRRGDPEFWGHSVHIFRNGHCEFFCDLGAQVNQITEFAKEKQADLQGAKQVIRYTDIAISVFLGLEWLLATWSALIPYKYMTLTATTINTKDTVLYSKERPGETALYGFLSRIDSIDFSEVINREASLDQIRLMVLQRLVNGFGLVLDNVLDGQGKFTRPDRMR